MIISNCLLYNKPDTVYAKQALKIRDQTSVLMKKAADSLELLDIDTTSGCLKTELPQSLFDPVEQHMD